MVLCKCLDWTDKGAPVSHPEVYWRYISHWIHTAFPHRSQNFIPFRKTRTNRMYMPQWIRRCRELLKFIECLTSTQFMYLLHYLLFLLTLFKRVNIRFICLLFINLYRSLSSWLSNAIWVWIKLLFDKHSVYG